MAKFLTEGDIAWACQHTTSAADAAEFLKVHYQTFKKYAELYWYDQEAQLTWFAHQVNLGGKNSPKTDQTSKELIAGNSAEQLARLINGKRRLSEDTIINAMIREAWKEEKCDHCGLHDYRQSDYKVPLLLHPIDGDVGNMVLENIRFLCYNCFFYENNSFPLQRRFFGKTK